MNNFHLYSVRSAFSACCLILSLLFSSHFLTAAPSLKQILSRQKYTDWQKQPASSPLKLENNRPVLPLVFPGNNRFCSRSLQPFLSTPNAASCRFTFALPKNLPRKTEITFYAVDHDFLWWQTTCPLSASLKLPLTGDLAAGIWQPRGHRRIWNDRVPHHLQELGFQIHPSPENRTACRTEITLKDISLLGTEDCIPLKICRLSWHPQIPRTGSTLEMSFQLNRLPVSPFDPKQLKIDCMITTPDRRQHLIRCFYYEDFLYDPGERDKTRCLFPQGKPEFRLRFLPPITGEYQTSFRITGKQDEYSYPGPVIKVSPGSAVPEFIRPDSRHPTFLQYEDGRPFLGLGMNVRSPYDNRYKQVAPYSLWEDQGLQAYDRLFQKYEKAGINVVEVWMSSWWLALEWIPDAPGFHGVGHYNQYRAWMLDHILRLAEKHRIYLILVFNNHGKFGMNYDTEWKRNPYNRANGGFLDRCEDFYTSAQAKNAFRNTADYIIARWGYSPRIMMWKLFTEVDLTGPTISFYHHPSVAAWHQEMSTYIHGRDPYQRMVTTHWMLGYHRINDAIATLPGLDCLTTDAYYQSGGSRSLVKMLQQSGKKAHAWNKPLIITEYGGSSYADNMGSLMKQVELGLWTGLFNEFSILPMYWWFALVEDKNLYRYYSAIRNFAHDEDRRDMKISHRELAPDHGTAVTVNEMRKNDRILLWLYDRKYFYSSDENLLPAKTSPFIYSLHGLPSRSIHHIEFWDTRTGSVISRERLICDEKKQSIDIRIPSFERSLAVKIH